MFSEDFMAPLSPSGAHESRLKVDALSSTPVNRPEANQSSAWKSALILANPIAGKGRAKRLTEEIAAGLTELGLGTEVRFSDAPGDISKLAEGRDSQHDLCVSVGGDGTPPQGLAGLGGAPPLSGAPLPPRPRNPPPQHSRPAPPPPCLARPHQTHRPT